MNLRNRVSAIHEVPPPKSFTFLSDACRGLEQARKVVWGGLGRGWAGRGGRWEAASAGACRGPQVLAYACVYSFYNQDTEHMDIVEQQIEALELHTNALQILLGEPPSPGTYPQHRDGRAAQPQPPTFTLGLELPVPRSLVTIFTFHPAGPRGTPPPALCFDYDVSPPLGCEPW